MQNTFIQLFPFFGEKSFCHCLLKRLCPGHFYTLQIPASSIQHPLSFLIFCIPLDSLPCEAISWQNHQIGVSPITVLIRNDISGFIRKHPSPDCRSLKSIYNSNNASPTFICPCIGIRVICYCRVCLGRFPGGFPPRPNSATCLHKIT